MNPEVSEGHENHFHVANVLLIDDSPDDRALVARELKKSGLELRITEISGEQQLNEVLAQAHFDIVVTDFQLRWSTGLDVLRKIKSHDPTCPVIMFTGSGSEEVAVEAMKEGLDDYITKTAKHYPRIPYVVAGLLQRLQQNREIIRRETILQETRKRAQEDLRASEERFRAIQETMPDGFVLLEAVRDEAGGVIDFVWRYANDAAARMAKRSREDLIGSRLLELYAGNRPLGLFDRYVEIVRTGKPWVGEVEYTLDGIDAFIRLAIARVDDGVAISIVDVSERRRAELALVEADRQKDEFLAMLAHELRNPLAPIRNAGELLARMLQDDARAQKIVEILRRQVTHLARLVDDLLDVSRITQKRIELKKEPLDVASIIAHAVETVEPLITARGHDFQIQSSYRSLTVFGDRARLVQCLVNVLTNAAKFTEPGGRIRLSSLDADHHAVIEVSDNGIGIPAQLLPQVFDLFVQSDRSLDRSQGGLGIGLSVVQRLIEMHGGQVSAHSDGPGQGSTFIIKLPLIERTGGAEQTEESTALNQQKILVVDDNADAANTLTMMLQLEGHEVRAVFGAQDALSEVAVFNPDTVLVDIGLPEMDGYKLAGIIRRLELPRAPVLIALTGYGQPEDRVRALHAGFDDHLVKPVDLSRLVKSMSWASQLRRGA